MTGQAASEAELVRRELELIRQLTREGFRAQAQLFDGEPEDADRLDRLFREGWAVVETYPAGETALRLVLRLRD